MKNNFIRVLKMAAFYSILGLLLQGFLVNILIASVPAEGQNLRDIKVTMNVKNISLQDALTQLENHSNFKFVYLKEEIPLQEKVTVSVTDESLYNILEVFAYDYGLIFNRINNQITIKKAEGWEKEKITSFPDPGTITGNVKEARTNKPIPGANVFVMGLHIGAAADLQGNYTIKNVPPGTYDLRISAVGYGKIQQRIVVQSGKTTEANYLLDEEAIGLDEVVVSGAAFETTRKEIPASITVLTAKELEKRNITYFADLLKGTIPGVISTSTGGLTSDNTQIQIRGTLLSSDNAKVYIDGIELSNTQFLSSLDVNTIERIEVIRGPHAVAMYGANATSGVINIVTKKGSSEGLDRPHIFAQFSGAYVQQGKVGDEQVPEGPSPFQTNNTLSISGGKNDFAYRVGITGNKTFEIIKNNLNEELAFSASAQSVQGPWKIGARADWSSYNRNDPNVQTWHYDNPNLFPRAAPTGWRAGSDYPNNRYENKSTLLGINIFYQPTESWFNKLEIGRSSIGYEYYKRSPYYFTPADSFVNSSFYNTVKYTYRFNTSFRTKLSNLFNLNISGGAELIQYNYDNRYYANIKFNANRDIVTFSNTTYNTTIYNRNNSSYFATADIGYDEKLYLSISTSILVDPYAYEKTRVVPPRLGFTYTDKLDNIEYRIRGLYGGTSLPINPSYVNPVSTSSFLKYLPNPNLVSEVRKGWELGTDLYFGKTASINLTYFSETGENVTTLIPLQIVTLPYIYQYDNAFSLKSNGIEFQGNANLGFLDLPWLSLKTTYTYCNNRYTSINPNLQATNAYYKYGPTGIIQVGDRLSTPVHSGSVDLTYDKDDFSISGTMIFSGGGRSADYLAFNRYYFGNGVSLDAGKKFNELGSTFTMTWNGNTYTVPKTSITRTYYIEYPVYFKFDLKVSYALSKTFTVFALMNNITNNTKADSNSFLTVGRITTLGVRISY